MKRERGSKRERERERKRKGEDEMSCEGVDRRKSKKIKRKRKYKRKRENERERGSCNILAKGSKRDRNKDTTIRPIYGRVTKHEEKGITRCVSTNVYLYLRNISLPIDEVDTTSLVVLSID